MGEKQKRKRKRSKSIWSVLPLLVFGWSESATTRYRPTQKPVARA